MDEQHERVAASSRWGIEPGYLDVRGQWRQTAPETLRRLVETLEAGGFRPAAAAERPHPGQAYQGDGRKRWILAVQLYAVRSRRKHYAECPASTPRDLAHSRVVRSAHRSFLKSRKRRAIRCGAVSYSADPSFVILRIS